MACDLVDLQDAVHLAALVLLLLHLLGESLPLALLDGVGVLERPAAPPVRLAHVVTRVTASGSAHTHTHKHRQFFLNGTKSSWNHWIDPPLWPRGLSVSLTAANQSRRRKEKGRFKKKKNFPLHDKTEFGFFVW